MNNPCTWIGPHGLSCTCTRPAMPTRNYCEDHIWLIYQKGTNLRRRHKDIRVANAVWDWESEFNSAVQELVEEGFEV